MITYTKKIKSLTYSFCVNLLGKDYYFGDKLHNTNTYTDNIIIHLIPQLGLKRILLNNLKMTSFNFNIYWIIFNFNLYKIYE